MKPKHLYSFTFLLVTTAGCFQACSTKNEDMTGHVERLAPGLDTIIRENVRATVIARGYEWSEGPLWIEEADMLLFSDVFRNTVYKWTEKTGAAPYLTPAGYTGSVPRRGELGSNGLLLTREGKLLLCQHGDRRLAVMEAPLNEPSPDFTSVAASYEGKRFNSPNDAVLRSNGDLFFTDPPYGMEQRAEDPAREIPFHGVYKASGGQVQLLTDSISRPNGIALTPDGKSLIVANSDPEKPRWYTFDLGPGDSLVNPGVLRDVTAEAGSEAGLPDGLKIDREGTIFASGPGGIWIFGKDRELLGKIKLPMAASNCALADDDRTLYITADSLVLRVRMR